MACAEDALVPGDGDAGVGDAEFEMVHAEDGGAGWARVCSLSLLGGGGHRSRKVFCSCAQMAVAMLLYRRFRCGFFKLRWCRSFQAFLRRRFCCNALLFVRRWRGFIHLVMNTCMPALYGCLDQLLGSQLSSIIHTTRRRSHPADAETKSPRSMWRRCLPPAVMITRKHMEQG